MGFGAQLPPARARVRFLPARQPHHEHAHSGLAGELSCGGGVEVFDSIKWPRLFAAFVDPEGRAVGAALWRLVPRPGGSELSGGVHTTFHRTAVA